MTVFFSSKQCCLSKDRRVCRRHPYYSDNPLHFCVMVTFLRCAAIAIWQLWSSMRDNSAGWLQATAWPILKGVADFWMSRLAADNPGAGPSSQLHIAGVMPPDEVRH